MDNNQNLAGASTSSHQNNQNNTENNSNESLLNLLNDDCLAYIFQFLSMTDKLKGEKVCQRWNYLISRSWINENELIIMDTKDSYNSLYTRLRENENRDENMNTLLNLFRRIGNHLTKVKLCFPSSANLDIEMVLQALNGFCYNIEYINIYDGVDCLNEGTLTALLLNNPNLIEVSLQELFLEGDCLLNLIEDTLESLSLLDCKHIDGEILWLAVSNFTNLKIIKICDNIYILQTILRAINISENVNFKEIALISNHLSFFEFEFNEELCEFFEKQKNLKIVQMTNIYYHPIWLSILTKEIEEIIFKRINIPASDLLNSLPDFKNLKKLHISFDDRFTSDHARAINYCKNLKELNISYAAESDNIVPNAFNNLSNLEIFKSDECGKGLTDNLLMAIAAVNNIKVVRLCNGYAIPGDDSNITDEGLRAIMCLPNLNDLYLSMLPNITAEPFSQLRNIRSLSCIGCRNVAEEALRNNLKNCTNLINFDFENENRNIVPIVNNVNAEIADFVNEFLAGLVQVRNANIENENANEIPINIEQNEN